MSASEVPPVDLVFVMDHPAQHFAPGLVLAAQHNRRRLRTYYWNDNRDGYHDGEFGRDVTWDVDLLSGYDHWSTDPRSPTHRRALAVLRSLNRDRPRVVVSAGWGTTIAVLAIAWCRVTRTPLFFVGDATWQYESRRGWRKLLRWLRLRAIFSGERTAALATGTFNRDFYVRFGVDPERILEGVLSVDDETYRAARHDDDSTTGPIVFGFVGKLLPIKGADELIRAVDRLPEAVDWELRIVGTGSEQDRLVALVDELGLGSRVHFAGFVNQAEMPATMAGFDLFVAPSREDRRILAVSEAIAAGVPVMISTGTAIWGPGDLIEDGVTGYVYRSGDVDGLTRRLLDFLDDPSAAQGMAARATERLDRRFSSAAFANQFDAAYDAAVRRWPRDGDR